jgi:hypothetical protein
MPARSRRGHLLGRGTMLSSAVACIECVRSMARATIPNMIQHGYQESSTYCLTNSRMRLRLEK